MDANNGSGRGVAQAAREHLLADTALRDLSGALDGRLLAAGFESVCGGAERGVRIVTCCRSDAKYSPGASCMVSYAIGGSRDGRQFSTIGVAAVVPGEVSYRLYLDDPVLSGLRAAVDDGLVRSRLGRLLGQPDDEPLIVESNPVRYKPGVSCVVRYQLGNAASGELFGKVFACGGERHTAVLKALAVAGDRDPLLPRVPRALAYWGDVGCLIQSPVRGANLKALALGDGQSAIVADAGVRNAGAALARIHSQVLQPGVTRTLAEDIADVRRLRPLVQALIPDLVARFDMCLTMLQCHASDRDRGPLVASHGSVRIDQFTAGRDGRIGLLDFDGFCWASPARDFANALAYLEWRALRHPHESERVARVERAWIDGYADGGGHAPRTSVAAYRAASLIKIAARSLRALRFDDWRFLPAVIDRAVAWSESAG